MSVNIIIYSKDRAFQLDALLSSFYEYAILDKVDIKIFVLYKTSSIQSQNQYENLKKEWSLIAFEKEENLIQQTIKNISSCEYVLFLVDDTLFYNRWNLENALQNLKHENSSIGFSLRLGKNTSFCYMLNCPQTIPNMQQKIKNTYCYEWENASCDFGYPLEISSSIYRSRDMIEELKEMQIQIQNLKIDCIPWFIESRLNGNKKKYLKTKALLSCFENSVAFSNPINLTKRGKNIHGLFINTPIQTLMDAYDKGFRHNSKKLFNLKINSSHQEIPLI